MTSSTYMTAMSKMDMSKMGTDAVALTSEGFAALTDHARLPSRFHARLAATASRLRG